MDSIAESTNTNYLPTPSSKVAVAGVSLRQSITARKLSLNERNGDDDPASVDETKQKRHKMTLRCRPQKTSDGNTESTKSTDLVYMCPECDRKFTDTKKLKNHRKVGHKLQEESLLRTPTPLQPDKEEVPFDEEQDR